MLRGDIVNSIACSGILAAYAVLRGGKQTRSVEEPFDLRPTSMSSRRTGADLKQL